MSLDDLPTTESAGAEPVLRRVDRPAAPQAKITRAEELRLQLADEIVRGALAPGAPLDETDIGAPVSGSRASASRASRSLPLISPPLRRLARMAATALRRRWPPRRRWNLPGTHTQSGRPIKTAAMSHEMVASVVSAACRMSAASWSALPANMVAEMTLKAFLETPFEGGRHQGRVDKIKALEIAPTAPSPTKRPSQP